MAKSPRLVLEVTDHAVCPRIDLGLAVVSQALVRRKALAQGV
jgi:hypothetical protein